MQPVIAQGYPLTAPAIAKLLRVKHQLVCKWCRQGAIEAIDVSESRNVRPRWRVSQAAFDSFVAARGNRKPVKTVARRRRTSLAPTEYFK